MTAAEMITLAVMREDAGTPDDAMEAFDPATFLMIFEMIMEIIAECQEKRGKRFASDELLARAQKPSRRHYRRAMRIAMTGDEDDDKRMSRRNAKRYISAASRAAATITAQQIDDAIAEEENAFADDE